MNPTLKNFFARIPGIPALWVLFKKLRALPAFYSDLFVFKRKTNNLENPRFSVYLRDRAPQLLDKTTTTHFEPHYTYHPAWAARVIAQIHPKEHVDISSFLPFNTLVSAFIPIRFYDYRPAEIKLSGLTCGQEDVTNLSFESNSIDSLSCLHTIEHIGLGRYGDPIDPEGDIKAAHELSRVLTPGGSLLIVTPVGRPRIEFNAHRIYSYKQVLDLFPGLRLHEFSLIPDDHKTHGLIRNADPIMVEKQVSGCGCFWFKKPHND